MRLSHCPVLTDAPADSSATSNLDSPSVESMAVTAPDSKPLETSLGEDFGSTGDKDEAVLDPLLEAECLFPC